MAVFDSRVLGYTTLRLAIGMSMLVHGLNRISHTHAFANAMAKMFAVTWLPRPSVLGFTYITGPVELAIGILVLFGLFTRTGLIAGGLWMVVLIFGATLIEQYDTVGIQLIYSLIFSMLLYFDDANVISVDRAIRRHSTVEERSRPGQ